MKYFEAATHSQYWHQNIYFTYDYFKNILCKIFLDARLELEIEVDDIYLNINS